MEISEIDILVDRCYAASNCMDTPQTDALFASIGSYLRSGRDGADGGACRGYWQEHSCISSAEIGMLARLGNQALCVEALAQMLGRDPARTRELLEALVAIGVLECNHQCYAATPAARLYCWASAEGCLPAE